MNLIGIVEVIASTKWKWADHICRRQDQGCFSGDPEKGKEA